LAVDWNAVNSAMQQSRGGHHLEAIAMLSALLSTCDSNSDRAAILLGQSSCYSRLRNIAKSRELLEAAKMCAIEHPDLLSQVEMSEGSLLSLNHEHDAACEKFFHVKAEFSDLLAKPENKLDFFTRVEKFLAENMGNR